VSIVFDTVLWLKGAVTNESSEQDGAT